MLWWEKFVGFERIAVGCFTRLTVVRRPRWPCNLIQIDALLHPRKARLQ